MGSILINDRASIGKDASLHINTAIVAGGTDHNAPQIGNGVVVGVGAVILGDITVADRTAIGANAVVNKSVAEEDVTVAGVPARIIGHGGSSAWNRITTEKVDEKKIPNTVD